jgi:glycosyltransferase involved in cell wall biosynthesis
MKVYYHSITSFSDVDMGIMHHLKPDVQTTYAVVIQKRNANYTLAELQDYCRTYGIPLEAYQMPYNLKDPRNLSLFWRTIRSIRRQKPDVVYMVTTDNIYLSLLTLLLSRSKTIIALHDVEFHSNTAFALPLKLARWLTMWHFRHFQVFSREQLAIFQRKYPNKQVHFIPLPLKDFGDAGRQAAPVDSVTRFLFFGNILSYKGLDVLLEAVNALAEESGLPPFELLIAGRSAEWDAVYAPLIRHPEVVKAAIRFVGNDEVAGFFQRSHYLVLPYRDATQSGPLKIAFHYNLPVIASDINSFKEEVRHGVDGYLFRNGDVADLTNVLRQALQQHAAMYTPMQTAQRHYVQTHYSPETLRHNFLQLFRSTVNGS